MHHVILGAGPAGVIAAETIRKHAPHDRITVIGDENEAPYSRMAIPYLLIGKVGEDGTHLRHTGGFQAPWQFRHQTYLTGLHRHHAHLWGRHATTRRRCGRIA